MEGQGEVSAREQHFHSQMQESSICFLLFAILYVVSYFIITRYKRESDEQEDEDAIVNRVSLFLSTFTLAVSAGAVLLLPFSIISNEILLSFPQNYYIQWLNGSLIHVMGQLLVKPTILEDLDEQIYIITLEEEAFQRQLNGMSSSVEYNIMELEQELENVDS
ncbi:Limb region 1 protein-like protein [Heterocephalus glaber]|uniref:Limb region 1 protein-like protein n=1 Tax=Heterocephalus glaber TaxID=10181 RepID=G5B3E7_HETGA|nr:Limb region 1 protein-like protein [Heterocephalus glaber]